MAPPQANGPLVPGRISQYWTGELSLEGLARVEERISFANSVKVGSGCLGDVLCVADLQTHEPLALKAVSLERLRKAGGAEAQLRREVRALSEIQHPNIVHLVDVLSAVGRLPHVVSEPPFLCIITEYIDDSEPLSRRIRRGGQKPQLALHILYYLADALAVMHAKGFVHRDVWSENILVDSKGRVVLIDFGSAEHTSDPLPKGSLNLPYASPQAVQGRKHHPSDDAWSLGLTVTEVTTGRFVIDRIGRSDTPVYKLPQVLGQSVSETFTAGGSLLGHLVARLLSVSREQRLTMREVLGHLQIMKASFVASPVAKHSSFCFGRKHRVVPPPPRTGAESPTVARPGETMLLRSPSCHAPAGQHRCSPGRPVPPLRSTGQVNVRCQTPPSRPGGRMSPTSMCGHASVAYPTSPPQICWPMVPSLHEIAMDSFKIAGREISPARPYGRRAPLEHCLHRPQRTRVQSPARTPGFTFSPGVMLVR